MKCSFCGFEIEKGTGKMLVKVEGSLVYFCSSKCEKNMIKLARIPRDVKWTAHSQELKGRKEKVVV